jgi:hypothetical protein
MITVYGASDDLIEVEGDIDAEFQWQAPGYGQPSGNLLAFSDGTVLRIVFDGDGVWRITPVVVGTAGVGIEQAPANDESNYSDRATFKDGRIAWVVQGIDYAPKH